MSLVVGTFVVLGLGELVYPLRRSTMPKQKRQLRNLIIAGLGVATSAVAEAPIVQPLARITEEKRWGLLGRARLPFWMEAALALVLMDYSFYFWHILLHRVPLLWRFHAVHHVDQDMDASTALRFHAGELLLSVPMRAAQVAAIGLTPRTFSLWQIWFALCVLFQHSNVRIPIEWERRLNRVISDTKNAWHSPFRGAGGDKQQLVERFDHLGLAARKHAPECSATGDYDWSARVLRPPEYGTAKHSRYAIPITAGLLAH